MSEAEKLSVINRLRTLRFGTRVLWLAPIFADDAFVEQATVVDVSGNRVKISTKTCPDDPFWTRIENLRYDPEFD